MSYISVGFTSSEKVVTTRPKRWFNVPGVKPVARAPVVVATSVLAVPTLATTVKAVTPSIMTAPAAVVGGGGGGGGVSSSWKVAEQFLEDGEDAAEDAVDAAEAAAKGKKSRLIPLAIGVGVLYLLLK